MVFFNGKTEETGIDEEVPTVSQIKLNLFGCEDSMTYSQKKINFRGERDWYLLFVQNFHIFMSLIHSIGFI